VAARRGNRRHRRCRRRPALTVSYVSATPATVSFTVVEMVNGRVLRGRCVAPSRAHVRGKACRRRVSLPGTLVRQAQAGRNAFTFAGRINGRRLAPGTYLLIATPIAGGGAGKPESARFELLP
jgi:hypothetical protein